MTVIASSECLVALADLGERLAPLRLADASALRAMRASLAQYGQLSPVRAFARDGELEVLDGFKRVRAARVLGLRELRALVVDADPVEATVHMRELHIGSGLTVLEEAWIVRELHREHGLTQGEIAARLRCHKSWVCRRLLLVEALDASVQADVRLGLLAPRAAVHVAVLPRGNQASAANVVIRRGLTVRQAATFVGELARAVESDAAHAVVARWSGEPPLAARSISPSRSAAETIARDVCRIRSAAGRLQVCLVTTPIAAFETSAVGVLRASLGELGNILSALTRTLADVLATSPSTIATESP